MGYIQDIREVQFSARLIFIDWFSLLDRRYIWHDSGVKISPQAKVSFSVFTVANRATRISWKGFYGRNRIRQRKFDNYDAAKTSFATQVR